MEQELEDIGVVIELKEEREARLDAEINKQEVRIKGSVRKLRKPY